MNRPAFAQSTATQQIESVTVLANASGTGVMVPIVVPKERSTVDQEFINTQPAGQLIFESLNFVPGYNFTNADPYGNSGGNVRIHGFDGNRISFTGDGMPLNDSGNYAIFTNQVADPEIIASATVNQGTTDVDSPTASAASGRRFPVTRGSARTMAAWRGTAGFRGLTRRAGGKFASPAQPLLAGSI